MKTIIQRPEKSRCQLRQSMIRESLESGYKATRVSDDKAQELCRNGKNYVYVPKSLYKNNSDVHYVHIENQSGWKLKKI